VFVDLERVPPEGEAVDRRVPAPSLSLPKEEFRLISDVDLSGRVSPVELDGENGEIAYRLRGELKCRLEVDCVRCLEPFEVDVDEELDLLYLPESRNVASPAGEDEKGSGKDDRGLGDEELSASFYRDNQIDLGHMILEQIVLSLPMKTLCRPDCLGLCPECGVNRNKAKCECTPEDLDPRWSTLKTLLGR
jgi:uncharacterized protein